jgi:hypothetical protein
MAREHANIRLDMWGDDDWRSLSLGAQHLYLHLLTSPTLSYAGIADWRPARLAGVSSDATTKSITAAADELQSLLFVIRDDETEEILIRSFLKYDGLMQKPNVAKAMVAAFTKTISRTLRGVLVFELAKLYERKPELKAFVLSEVTDLLSKPSLNPSTIGNTKGSVKGSEVDPSLLTTNYLLLTTDNSLPATPKNDVLGADRDDVMGLCIELQRLVVDNGSKEPTITDKWISDARLMLDKDKREYDTAIRLMRWASNDSFWRSNVMSISTFREKFDRLRLDANRQIEERKKNPTRTEENMAFVSGLYEQAQQMEIES